MATRLMKEARELLPVLLGTLVLMALPGLLGRQWTEAAGQVTVLAFGLGCVVMAGLAFGSELQHRTLGLFLSQPIRRWVLWREKMLVLGMGIAVTFGAGLCCLELGNADEGLNSSVVLTLALVALCAFCGTPWLTLLTRSGIGGVVFAAVLPAFVGAIVTGLAACLVPRTDEGLVTAAQLACLIAYCPLAYWRGYCRFRNLQVQDGQAPELALPARVEAALAHGLGAILPGITGPFVALMKKELRLQQMSFALAGVFCLLAGIACVSHFISHQWSDVLLTVDYAIYLILLPFMAGAMAVAEERGLGIAEWHLTLPASARTQWSAKMLVTLPTSVLLGVLLPAVFILVGDLIFRWPDWRGEYLPVQPAVLVVLVQLLATSVAVYSASVCGSTIRAILLAFGMIVAGCTLVFGEANWIQRTWSLGHTQSPYVAFLYGSWFQRLFTLGWHQAGISPSREQVAWALSCAGLLLAMGLLQALGFANFRRCGVSARWFVVQLVGFFLLVGWLGLRVCSVWFSLSFG